MFGLIQDSIYAGGVPFLMMSIALLPMAWPWWRSRRALQQGATQTYVVHLWAALVVCAVLSWMMWPFLFGDGLQQGSTAGLIFLVAPIYGFMALWAAYALAWGMGRVVWAGRVWGQVPPWTKHLGALPLVWMCVMGLGMAMTSAQLLRLGLPEKATHPDTFLFLVSDLDLQSTDRAARRLASAIAGNPHAPADVLARLSGHSAAAVRLRVAQHAHTDAVTLSRLRLDCVVAVREAADQRLPVTGGQAAYPGGECD